MKIRMNSEPSLDYTIILPVYHNEGLLVDSIDAIKREVIDRNPARTCEVIFVDDGSGDDSLDELLRIRRESPKLVKVIKLSRNFGQVHAIFAGLSQARGRCMIAMSADGQDPPSLINDMLRAHFEEGYEIVACERMGRDESIYRVLTSKLFYSLIKKLSFPNMPLGGFDYVLLSRRIIEILLENHDAHPFFQGQILWTGFRTKFIKYRRQERKKGKSRWTLGKKVTYLIDGVMGYSFIPIRLISVMGVISALLGILYAGLIFIFRIFGGIPIKGWAPLMIVVLLMGGFQMLMLGVIGEYLWRTLAQVRNRDPYIIEAIYDNSDSL